MVSFRVCRFVAVLAVVCATTQFSVRAADEVPANPAVQVAIPATSLAGNADQPGTVAPPPEPTPTPTATPTPTPTVTPNPAQSPKQSSQSNGLPTLPNWVGPQGGKTLNSACYRKTYRTTKKQCGAGYNFDGALTCWTQCPIEYPVECAMECLPQNKDCTKAILKKVTSVVNVALNAATGGVFGSLTKAGKAVQTGVKCGQQLFSITKKITAMVEEVENGAIGATEDTILFAVNKADFVVYDLPAAVATCMGVPIPQGLGKAKAVTDVVQQVVTMAIKSKRSGVNLGDFGSFMNATKSAVPIATASIEKLSSADAASLDNIIKTGGTCGMDLNTINNKIIVMIQDLKTTNAGATSDMIKFAVLNSDVVLKDLPRVASSCATATKEFSSREAAATGYPSRDAIIKTVHTMIDKVIGATDKDDKPVSNADFGIAIADMGLETIAMIDPTGIAAMAAEFLQPVCGPTNYLGRIDSGPADQALGLTTIQKAFRGSSGNWNTKGDGQVRITFKSVDDKDVKVNIMSGGQKWDDVKVKKGRTVEWWRPISELGGKTLYLDRWRGGILGIPGTGGGSLLAWVPSQNDGGLSLTVMINPTSFKDKDLRN